MTDINKIQEHVLLDLLRKAERTLWGNRYDFQSFKNYDDFRSGVPTCDYAFLKPAIERIQNGEPDILWPGQTNDFAVSSGTTGTGKHLPLSKERLQSDRRFMRKLIRHFVRQRPELQIWLGKQAGLPGSVEDVLYNGRNLAMGEISGFMARDAPKWLTPFQIISPRNLCRMTWKEKFDTSLGNALKKDVRVIAAVPSWTLIFLQNALRLSGCKSIKDLWPNLKLIVSGGVALKNYRYAIEKLCSPLPLQFMESYGASEGYFAFTRQLGEPDLRLIIDNGIFYEWVPFKPGLDEAQLAGRAIPAWEIETGIDYIMLITTNSGLWRYPVNDIIRFKSKDPLSIEIRGRVSEMMDDYGEAVHYSELEAVLEYVESKVSGKHQRLLASVRPPDSSSPPYHIWMIEWKVSPGSPLSEGDLARLMDRHLVSINRHYAIRRESGAMGQPVVLFLSREYSDIWLPVNQSHQAQTKPVHIMPFSSLPENLSKKP